jgi:hypothetical protein
LRQQPREEQEPEGRGQVQVPGGAAIGDVADAILAIVAVSAAIATPFTPPASYQASIARAVAFIRLNTAPTDPVFVGLTSNRYTLVNPLLVYYLADRTSGVRDTMYNPGITNREATQVQMIADLDRSNTRYLVLDRVFASACEPVNPGSTEAERLTA